MLKHISHHGSTLCVCVCELDGAIAEGHISAHTLMFGHQCIKGVLGEYRTILIGWIQSDECVTFRDWSRQEIVCFRVRY